MENHPLYLKVQAALDSIRPYLIADGGNVEIVEITEDNRLKLNLLGACKSCNMSAMTFKAGVEEAIRREVPEIISVEELSQTVQS
ncbi:NifU family protein [Aquirufa nivalisilvae]|uniref:Fe/S bioproteinis protein NfuA n=1 Tax=Aquirufa nivalisilvae TaxID=2516557 RepID=A0A2S2DT40_9BACT|nr:NifU family protein [Aquirufa nivalisilvae]AWL08564.1 Fe/S bioproteinis protein NfuA [Aquirufa nivalisilvae]MCZ2479036.1 NifU family protein [Aquirufa nivalisilvae]MCZ2483299.1 NifU family protein [Aquirufa nivalisilvae]